MGATPSGERTDMWPSAEARGGNSHDATLVSQHHRHSSKVLKWEPRSRACSKSPPQQKRKRGLVPADSPKPGVAHEQWAGQGKHVSQVEQAPHEKLVGPAEAARPAALGTGPDHSSDEEVLTDVASDIVALEISRQGMASFRQGVEVLSPAIRAELGVVMTPEQLGRALQQLTYRAMWLRARSAHALHCNHGTPSDQAGIAVWVVLAANFEGIGADRRNGSVRRACKRHCGLSNQALEHELCRASMQVWRGR